MRHLKFLGIMLGVAIRTKKPLALHLAQPIWKLLAGMSLTTEDLEEVTDVGKVVKPDPNSNSSPKQCSLACACIAWYDIGCVQC